MILNFLNNKKKNSTNNIIKTTSILLNSENSDISLKVRLRIKKKTSKNYINI